VLVLVLFKNFTSNLDDRMESTLSKFVDDTNLEGVADTSEGCDTRLQDLGKLES